MDVSTKARRVYPDLFCKPLRLCSAMLWNLQRLGAAAQGRVIGHSQIQTEELKDRADQSLSLAQRQTEHRPQRQRRPDRQSRVVGLTTACCARLSPPGRDRVVREPDGQTSALAQGCIVLGPVRHSVPLLRNVVPGAALALKGTADVRQEGRSPPMSLGSGYQLAYSCNNAACHPQSASGAAH
jgi:hypothetical protein